MDFFSNKDKSRKTYSVFATFIMCCLGTSLMISALATQYWFQSGCKNGGVVMEKSSVNFGLFSGKNVLNLLGFVTSYTKVVCSDGECMFSCGKTADLRKYQLEMVKNGTVNRHWATDNCDRVIAVSSAKALQKLSTRKVGGIGVAPLYASFMSFVSGHGNSLGGEAAAAALARHSNTEDRDPQNTNFLYLDRLRDNDPVNAEPGETTIPQETSTLGW